MVKNYLKLAFRNFKRRKGHTIINVLGLAIAVACCIFIGLYVQHELSYDRFHPNSDDIYRLMQTSVTPEETNADATTPFPLAPTLLSEYPHLIEKKVRLYNSFDENHTFILSSDTSEVSKSNIETYLESYFYFADSLYFEFFDAKLIRGNPKTALSKPLSLVITPEIAKKFFGDEDPIGKTVYYNTRRMNMTVTGIMEPLPANSHFKADILASFNSLNVYYSNPEELYSNWFGNRNWTYVQLKDGINADELSSRLPAFVEKYYSNTRDENATFEIGLQPLERIHLYSDLNYELQSNGSIFYIYLFSTAALLLLLIACINFMNLATARAAERSREVGIRKALGAGRFNLFLQFMGEAFLLTVIAVLIAVGFVMISMPFFNNFIGQSLVFNPFQNSMLLLGIIGLIVVVGLFAGAYPALYLSGLEPQKILRGDLATGKGSTTLRKGLVIVQFTMSVILIIGTIVVYLQLQHLQEKKLGFEKQHIAIMPISGNLIAWEYPAFKQRVEQNSSILSVTGMGKILGSDEIDSWKIAPAGKGGQQGETNHALWVLHDFIETFGVRVVAGRSFSKEYATDGEKSLLINEKMAQKLGHDNPQAALGELFYYTDNDGGKNKMQVIGVVEDFNYTSVKKEIKPTVICLAYNQGYRLGAIHFAAAKIVPGRTQQALARLEEVWSDINLITPFNYSFQEEELEKIYASEATTSSVMGIFTVLCILVACLGLFGLASFTASKRTKEIGIRKTLGASESGIVLLLSKEYFKIVLIANIIAWPVIYYLTSWWLQDFPYRLQMGWNMAVIFLGVGLLSILICLITVGYQSLKAALLNPVESIRQE